VGRRPNFPLVYMHVNHPNDWRKVRQGKEDTCLIKERLAAICAATKSDLSSAPCNATTSFCGSLMDVIALCLCMSGRQGLD
jgi:hypothetical protein